MQFRQYLTKLAAKSMKQIKRYVIGNSSVDYDSFFGSIILAFVLTSSTKHFHVPIIDCKQEEVYFRFEIIKILNRLSIDQKIFKYRQELLQIDSDSTFILYDHNVRKQFPNIEYIVDHHDYKQLFAKKYLITKMGSALTHLYYLINPSKLQMMKSDYQEDKEITSYTTMFTRFVQGQPFQKIQFDTQSIQTLQEIIRYGILLDTFNLDKKQKERWTILDLKALEWIQSNKVFDFGFRQLEDLKFDIFLNRGLSLKAALVKDYKIFEYNNLIIEYSIIYLNPKEFYTHYQEELEKDFQTSHDKSQVYMLMSIFKGQNGTLEREILFRVKDNNEEIKNLLYSFLKQMNMIYIGSFGIWNHWRDQSATISRKVFDKEFRKYYTS